MTTDMESRLAHLEETVFFQERLVGELNEALTEQQRQIDSLSRYTEALRLRLEAMQEQVEAGNGPANVPPPHYL